MDRSNTISPGMWAGRDVAILGGGPSGARAPMRELIDAASTGDLVVLATNDRCDASPAFAAVSYDVGWLRARSAAGGVANRPAVALTKEGTAERYPPFIEVTVRRGRNAHWPRDLEGGLVAAENTGVGALALADVLCGGDGAIYLYGYDLHNPNADERYAAHLESWRLALERFRPDIRTPVYVSSPSALSDAWPRRALPLAVAS